MSTDGTFWDVLFLSFYHPRKSQKAPLGYRMAGARERPAFVTCTNFRVEGFPHPMEEAIRECMRQVLGFPVGLLTWRSFLGQSFRPAARPQ